MRREQVRPHLARSPAIVRGFRMSGGRMVPHAYWVVWLIGLVLGGFAIPEAIAIRSKQSGDTLSENIRRWLRTDTPGGGWTWLGTWSALLVVWVWLLGHILKWWH